MEDLIIIIPTHNRQHYLRRVINYYSEFPCKVYICDTSKEKADVESCGNIIYRWVPQSNFYGKVLDVLNETSANFYALSPDDDFLKQETLMECYDALANNSSFSVGMGKQILFEEQFDGHFIYRRNLNLLNDISAISFHHKESYVKYFESHYQNILWSVFPRDVVKKSFESLTCCNFGNGNYIELILGIESLRKGYVYMSEQGLNYREYTKSEHWGTTTKSLTWDNIRLSDEMQNDYNIFKMYYKDDEFADYCMTAYLDSQNNVTSKGILVKTLIRYYIKLKIKLFYRKNIIEEQGSYYDDIMSNRLLKIISC